MEDSSPRLHQPCFPLFLDLSGRRCLVVGGGAVAARKVQALTDFGAEVLVVAGLSGQDVRSPESFAHRETGVPPVQVVERDFRDGDVEGMTLVVAATDDAVVNARVAALCKAKGILVNVVDDPANCTFYFPAIIRKGPMVAAVSSGGASPVAAKLVRDKIAGLLPDDFVAAVTRLGEEREEMKRRYPDPQERRERCEKELAKWKD